MVAEANLRAALRATALALAALAGEPDAAAPGNPPDSRARVADATAKDIHLGRVRA